jgi:Spy/CpxP family protein refolding chaperone
MFTVRKMIPALCLATSLTGLAVHAATTEAPPTTDADGGHQWHRSHHHGFMGMMLHKLTLTDAQKAHVTEIMQGEKTQFAALRESARANREALATTPPTDPAYQTLIQTAEANAATRIKLESETWGSVYADVLTKEQRDAIPGIVAAAQAERQQRMAAWKAQHSQAAGPAGN